MSTKSRSLQSKNASCQSAFCMTTGTGVQGLLGAVNAGLHAKKRSISTSRPLLQTQAARQQQEARLADALTAVHAAQDVIQGNGFSHISGSLFGLLPRPMKCNSPSSLNTPHPSGSPRVVCIQHAFVVSLGHELQYWLVSEMLSLEAVSHCSTSRGRQHACALSCRGNN